MTHHSTLTLTLALLLGVVAVGRCSRLVTHDHWPPIEAVRIWWITLCGTKAGGRYGAWAMLMTCPFCFAPYAAAVNLTWALLSGLQWGTFWGSAWWIVNVWAAVSYLAAILVVFDEPADVD